MNIRVAQPGEAGRVMGLVNAAFMEDAFFKLPQHAQRIHAVEELCGMVFLVCELRDDGDDEAVLVGCVRVERKSEAVASFSMLSVDKQYTKRGIGKRLVRAAERHFPVKAVEILVINIQSHIVSFYVKQDYEPSPAPLDFYDPTILRPEYATKVKFTLLRKHVGE